MKNFLTALLLMVPGLSAAQSVNLPQCSAPFICLTFGVPSLIIAPGGSITYGDGSVSTTSANGGSTPIGAAGGDLSGSYPNPLVVRTESGSVDFSTITVALAGKLSSTSGVPPSLIDLSTVTTVLNAVAVSTTANAASIAVNTAKFITNSSSMTNNSAQGILVTSSVTAGSFYGDGSHLSGIVAAASGISTGAVTTAALSGNGNSSSPLGVVSSSVAVLGASGLVLNSQLDGSSVTKQGNSFNGSSQLVQTTSGGLLPVLSAANLTHVTAASVDAGSLGAAVIASSVAAGAVSNGNLASGIFSNITGVGTQGQALNMGSHQINAVTDPSAASDAATKNYVDSSLNGLQFKQSARLATTAALPTNSYSNGASGVGATLTGIGVGQLSVDGAVANFGDRLLVNNEALASHNGIYTVTQNSSIVVYILTRAVDYNQPSEMGNGTALFIDSGTVNTNAGYVNVSSVTTVGTDAINFSQFNGVGDITAGPGLLKSGNTLSVDSSSVAFKTGGAVSVTNGGTGATTASGARTSLGAAASGANADVTSMSALSLISSAYTETSSMTDTSANGLLVASSVTAGAFFGDGSHETGAVAPGRVDLSTVTTALSVKASTGANADITSLTAPISIAAAAGSSNKFVLRLTSGSASFDDYGSSTALTDSTSGTLPVYQTRRYAGTLSSPTAIPDATDLGGFSATGFDGSGYPSGGSSPGTSHYLSSGAWSSTNHGTYYDIFTTPLNSVTRQTRVRITDAGDIGVNTTSPTAKMDISGTLNVQSSATATAFFGDPSHMASGYVVTVSSYIASTTTIASVTNVAVTTVTATGLRGSRPMSVRGTVELNNGAGGARTYTCQLAQDGVLLEAASTQSVVAGGNALITIPYYTSSSPASGTKFAINCLTNNATATQSAGPTHIIVEEY